MLRGEGVKLVAEFTALALQHLCAMARSLPSHEGSSPDASFPWPQGMPCCHQILNLQMPWARPQSTSPTTGAAPSTTSLSRRWATSQGASPAAAIDAGDAPCDVVQRLDGLVVEDAAAVVGEAPDGLAHGAVHKGSCQRPCSAPRQCTPKNMQILSTKSPLCYKILLIVWPQGMPCCHRFGGVR